MQRSIRVDSHKPRFQTQRMHGRPYFRCIFCASLSFGCLAGEAPDSNNRPVDFVSTAPSASPDSADIPRSDGPTEEDYPALHNLLQVSGTIYSGGEPHSEEAFAELVQLGVRTVVSVDGAKPDVEAARRHGLRYVHIPIGYDGIAREAGRSLARLIREAEEPYYVHCHHGRHRGPAAAAVACIAAGEADGKQALGILEQAGTSQGYAGLWCDVEIYQPPAAHAELPELVEVAEVGSLAAAMAQIDRAYDNLKLCREAEWASPKKHVDLAPAQQALLLKEALRESGRNLADDYGEEFRIRLGEAEQQAQQLEETLKAGTTERATKLFGTLKASCQRCHEKHRN